MSTETTKQNVMGILYRSNRGRGPLFARVLLSRDDGYVEMEYWNPKRPRRRQIKFELREAYLHSPSCGWKRWSVP